MNPEFYNKEEAEIIDFIESLRENSFGADLSPKRGERLEAFLDRYALILGDSGYRNTEDDIEDECTNCYYHYEVTYELRIGLTTYIIELAFHQNGVEAYVPHFERVKPAPLNSLKG